MATTASLTTTLRNISNKTLSFGFIPPHGRRLTPGQSISIDGDIRSLLADNPRKFAALNDALLDGLIALVDTPDEHFFDPTLDITQVLKVDNSVVSVQNPSWGLYSSSL